eukprot:1211974-Pleurochrysis_carterae.AAC.1
MITLARSPRPKRKANSDRTRLTSRPWRVHVGATALDARTHARARAPICSCPSKCVRALACVRGCVGACECEWVRACACECVCLGACARACARARARVRALLV